jgi:hypothetical protein
LVSSPVSEKSPWAVVFFGWWALLFFVQWLKVPRNSYMCLVQHLQPLSQEEAMTGNVRTQIV